MKKIGVWIFLFLFCMNFISATTTEIKIVTYPSHDIRLEFINPNAVEEKEAPSMEIQRLESGDGEISTTFTTAKEVFNINYVLSVDGEKVLSGSAKDLTSGESLLLSLFKNNVEVVEGYAEEETEEVEEIVEENASAEATENESVEEVVEDANLTEEVEEETEEVSEGDKFNLFDMWFFIKLTGFATSDDGTVSKNFLAGAAIFVLLLVVAVFAYKKNLVFKKGNTNAMSKEVLDEVLDEMDSE